MKTNNRDKVAILGGIRYRVFCQDDQIIMRHNGIKKFELAFDRPIIKATNKPGFWLLSHIETDSGSIPLIHLVDAFSFLGEEFGECGEKYKGELAVLNN